MVEKNLNDETDALFKELFEKLAAVENLNPEVDEDEHKDYRKVLFVVLHGLISLVEVPHGGLVAHVINMGSEHRYLYGDWLAEEQMPTPNEYGPMKGRLVGVKSGTAELDCKNDAVLQIPTLSVQNQADIRAIIHLPQPYKIHYPLRGLLDDALDGHLGSLATMPKYLAGTRVLEYEFTKAAKVALVTEDGRSWRCPNPPAQRDDLKLYFGVLHIYNEPYHFIQSEISHNRQEFNKGARFFGSDIILTDDTTLTGPDPLPPLLEGELVFLADRQRFVNRLTYLARKAKIKTPVGSGPGQVCNGPSARLAPTQ